MPISRIAEKLEIHPVSVNQMMNKLADLGYVEYTPYKGVELLNRGQDEANRLIRNRRIWEVFLVDNLKLPLSIAEELACDLEHVTNQMVISRLEEYLGFPRFSPKGKPIPAGNESFPSGEEQLLSEAPVGQGGIISGIKCEGQDLNFITEQGLHKGLCINVAARGKANEILLEYADGKIIINEELAENIIIEVLTNDK